MTSHSEAVRSSLKQFVVYDNPADALCCHVTHSRVPLRNWAFSSVEYLFGPHSIDRFATWDSFRFDYLMVVKGTLTLSLLTVFRSLGGPVIPLVVNPRPAWSKNYRIFSWLTPAVSYFVYHICLPLWGSLLCFSTVLSLLLPAVAGLKSVSKSLSDWTNL